MIDVLTSWSRLLQLNDFYINTPVRYYNPNWAMVSHEGSDIQHIYFLAETKGYDKDSLKEIILIV